MEHLKPGGGGWPQPYDPDNGQYTEKNKKDMLKSDIDGLKDIELYGTTKFNTVHFPTYGIHDNMYSKMFVAQYRYLFNSPWIHDDKVIKYLFDPIKSQGKTQYLLDCGYTKNKPLELLHDLGYNTLYNWARYKQLTQYCLKVKCLTSLKNGKLVTTIWQVNPKNYRLEFITLIPREGEFTDE